MTPEWVFQTLLTSVGIIGSGAVWYLISQKRFLAALWTGSAGAVAMILLVALYIQNDIVARRERAREPVFHGELIAGNEKTPPLIPPDVYSVLLGDAVEVRSHYGQHFVFARHGQPFIEFRIDKGKLYVSALIADTRGEQILRMIDNEFQASPERAFNPKQPDPHTLVVRDMDGNEVLNIRYLNPRVIRLVGRFHVPGFHQPLLVLPDHLVMVGEIDISGITFDLGENERAGFIDF